MSFKLFLMDQSCQMGFLVIDPSQMKRSVNAKERELVTSLKGLCKAHRPELYMTGFYVLNISIVCA